MQTTCSRPKLVVAGGGRGVVAHAGARLLTDLADKTGLTSRFIQALGLNRQRRSAHDPGRVAADLAVLLADGGQAIADLAVLRARRDLFELVASDATAWRVLDCIDEPALARLRAARATARELAWAQLTETGRSLSATTVLGRAVAGFVLDLDATIVLCHSDKESTAPTWKHSFGYHPLLCFLDGSGEALAALLRPGNAGSNTAADHITVLDRALQQIPDHHRYGSPILIRSDSAGSSHAFLAHIRQLRQHGLDTQFSVGVAITEPCDQRSPPPPTESPPSTPTAACATARRSPRSPTCSSCTCWPLSRRSWLLPPLGREATPCRVGTVVRVPDRAVDLHCEAVEDARPGARLKAGGNMGGPDPP